VKEERGLVVPDAGLGSVSLLPSVPLRLEYRTGESDIPSDFYSPCLRASVAYDRAVGFFATSVFLIVGDAVLDFARRGGHIRIVCSPILTAEDAAAIEKGYEQRRELIGIRLVAQMRELEATSWARDRLAAVATLVAAGAMDFRVAIRPSAHGIYHEKIGIFRDAESNSVTFRGSSNETWSAWHPDGNLESFDVFRSWEPSDAPRVAQHAQYFNRLWHGEIPHLEVIELPDAARRALIERARPSLDDLELLLGRITSAVVGARSAFPHQRAALANWNENGCRGILQHATGSGKTYTALLAIEEHVRKGGPAAVFVPSRLLLRQWHDELARHLPDASLLLVGAGHDVWRQKGRVEAFLGTRPDLPPRIVLGTLQTAATEPFRERLRSAADLLVVVDEVHTAGSPRNAGILEIAAAKRLGLSATPKRYGDPAGTQQILSYFERILQPIVTLADAIQAGCLVPYEYYPHVVRLSESEDADWCALTEQIAALVARSNVTDGAIDDERLKNLLIQRARIAKRAEAKVPLAVNVLTTFASDGDRWLVYCEDIAQLSTIRHALRDAGVQSTEYHSQMQGDPEATLKWFRDFGGILLSIRCLDEGVDIPAVSHALILASSQNPRQFIQRRGRVLRKSPGKAVAVVHDAIVVPQETVVDAPYLSLARGEMVRALEFATSARNPGADLDIKEIAARMGLNLGDLADTGLEEEVETEVPDGG